MRTIGIGKRGRSLSRRFLDFFLIKLQILSQEGFVAFLILSFVDGATAPLSSDRMHIIGMALDFHQTAFTQLSNHWPS